MEKKLEPNDKFINEQIGIIIQNNKVKSFMFYDIEHEKQRKIFEKINTIVGNYYNDNNVTKLIQLLTAVVKKYPDHSTKILRDHGIWSLPPSLEVTNYLTTLNLSTIIDFGAGNGLWSSIIHKCMPQT